MSAELHVLAGAGHGFGARASNHGATARWLELVQGWRGHRMRRPGPPLSERHLAAGRLLQLLQPAPTSERNLSGVAARGGTSCAGYEPGLTCEYSYCYELIPLARCGAESLLWETINPPFACNPPPMECPSRPPALGTGCYYVGQQCDYGTCGDPDDPRSATLCLGGFWVEPEGDLCPTPGVDAGVGGSVDAGASDAGVADGG